uniref:Uncharacterized protein n=1 Tax=Acrobeloides nanus TaxID=290746 RepID=A0A914DHL6_9BILA
YKWYKSLLKEEKVDEAIRVLENIPEDQSVPKVKYALAKLHLTMTRPSPKTTRSTTPKWVKYFKCVTDQVPVAVLCKSYLVDHGLLNAEEDPLINLLNPETRIWLLAKQAEANRKYIDATEILSEFHTTNLRIVLELARLYHIAGDRQKALANFERAHSLNYSNASGMDIYASLLYAVFFILISFFH